ncbi:MAG: hypothetical protein CVV42_12930 [Candidatus Riflebacteria bacterium HGW-Riflebacteria-2]|jgi:hypothetical protein|nr:MAG: hypothetical protein CVV42_12930 [Candidatus Riflebacteria bacterium HGW-Riflebacteria-2]
MKKVLGLVLAMMTLLSLAPGYASGFDFCSDDLAEKLKNKVLQNGYARRLLFPKSERTPTVAATAEGQAVTLFNIHDSKELWTGSFRLDQISNSDILNLPIFPGAFHFAALFNFKDPVIIVNKQGKQKQIRGLLMGTGPEADFSVQGIAGMQLIQMRVYSLEYYESIAPIDIKYRHRVNPEKIDLVLFFLAHVEECARLAAMTHLRALRAEYPDRGDEVIFQKYNVFGANCVSSGIQNVTRAIKPAYRDQMMNLVKKDVKELTILSVPQFRYWIKSWNQVSSQALAAIVGQRVSQEKFRELETFHRHLRRTNMMSLPWRAKKVIDWATSK